MQPIVAFDIETTGLRDARPVQIALVCADGRHLCMLINPEKRICTRAWRVHGISNEQVQREGTTWREAAPIIRDFLARFAGDCRELTLVAHNAGFDWRILRSENARCNVTVSPPGVRLRVVCTLQLARRRRVFLNALRHMHDEELKLTLAYLYWLATGSDLEGAHDALADARACLAIYLKPGFLKPLDQSDRE